MSTDVVVPRRVFTHLVGGLVHDTARKTLEVFHRPDRQPGTPIHLGDPFGLVLSWLWKTDPDLAVAQFAELMAYLRKWDQQATTQITLDDVLDGLFLCLQGLTDQEAGELTTRLSDDVPAHFTTDLNSTQ